MHTGLDATQWLSFLLLSVLTVGNGMYAGRLLVKYAAWENRQQVPINYRRIALLPLLCILAGLVVSVVALRGVMATYFAAPGLRARLYGESIGIQAQLVELMFYWFVLKLVGRRERTLQDSE